MKKKKIVMLIFVLLCNTIYYSQVGVNTVTPSSTLDVRGSIEGNYRAISATSTLTNTDYHISFVGTSDADLNIPVKSTTDGTASDFRGRKINIKNNSATSTLILKAAPTEIIRSGGSGAGVTSYPILPGNVAFLTAGDGNGWDLDVVASANASNDWILTQTALNGFRNTYQSISGLVPSTDGAKATINNCSVTVTVPSGVTENRVTLIFTGWGDATVPGAATGSLRFQIVQTGTQSSNYSSVMMTSWSIISAGNVRYSFPISYAIDNLPPGTYTFSLRVNRENEYGSAPSGGIGIWGVQSRADVFIKN